jgi:Domain of unknown function (DUF4145)
MDAIYRVVDTNKCNIGTISTECPRCGQLGTFEIVPNMHPDIQNNKSGIPVSLIGLRRCPDTSCRLLIFIITDIKSNILFQYPPSRISFEAKNVPKNIAGTLKEAIECNANNCHRAAAAMVRRTIEEICEEKGVTGNTLFDRIEALKSQVVIAPALFEAMHDIRFLGNDAVHIELKWFDDVGKEELLVAIKITKKIIEAIYQSEDLVNELKALKKPPTTP